MWRKKRRRRIRNNRTRKRREHWMHNALHNSYLLPNTRVGDKKERACCGDSQSLEHGEVPVCLPVDNRWSNSSNNKNG